MKMQKRFFLVVVLAIVLSATSNSFAAIYKYIDENGIVCFANDLQSVPEKCRSTAKIVSGDQEEGRKPALLKQPQAQAEARPGNAALSTSREKAPIEVPAKSLFSGRALISLVVVVSALFAFVILGILDADHKKSIKIVRVVIVWGMSVYLIVAHAGDVVTCSERLKARSIRFSVSPGKREKRQPRH